MNHEDLLGHTIKNLEGIILLSVVSQFSNSDLTALDFNFRFAKYLGRKSNIGWLLLTLYYQKRMQKILKMLTKSKRINI